MRHHVPQYQKCQALTQVVVKCIGAIAQVEVIVGRKETVIIIIWYLEAIRSHYSRINGSEIAGTCLHSFVIEAGTIVA